ncbi:GPI anchored protein [Aspergillus fumigatus]|nr:GPI anchored protein [Aspergillus fumigatus]
MRVAVAAVVLGAGAITSAQLSSIPQCSPHSTLRLILSNPRRVAVSKVVVSLCSGVGHPVSVPPVDASAPTSTAAASFPTTASSSNSTTVSGLGGSSRTSFAAPPTSTLGSTTLATVNTASPSPSPSSSSPALSNGASRIESGVAQVAGAAILLASVLFLV